MPFEVAITLVEAWEALYSDHKEDRGGETFCGIARNKHPSWPGWSVIDQMKRLGQPIQKTPELSKLVLDFYYTNFWIALKCDQIDKFSPTISHELFEASVNCGPIQGGKFLQRALNLLNRRGELYADLEVDGSIGPKTITALKACLKTRPSMLLYKCQNGEQYCFYREWSQAEDFPGVFNRV